MLRKFVTTLIVTLCATGIGDAVADEKGTLMFSVYGNYGSWNADSIDNSGGQSMVYSQLVYDASSWGASVTMTYASTSYDTIQSDNSFNVSGLTDTVIGTYYSAKINDVSIRAGVDLIVPTGKNSFPLDERQSMITDDVNSDLMLLNHFGGGLSFRPHVIAAVKRGRVAWAAGFNYLVSGSYDTSGDLENDTYDPGDKLVAVISANIDTGDDQFALVTLSFTTAGRDTLDGDDIYRQGDVVALEARYVRNWFDLFKGTLGGKISMQGKNDIVGTDNSITSETGNSNGNIMEIFFSGRRRVASDYSLTGVLGTKHVAANSYSMGEGLADAGRDVVYLEPGLIWIVDSKAYVTAKLRYATVSDYQDDFSPEDARYNVITLEVGMVYSF